jgi:1-acyl-sn-glycerol-3-phosphate acyltransferase
MAYKRGEQIAAFGASFIPAIVTYHIIMLLVLIINRLLFRVKIEGRHRLQAVQSGLLVSNHTLVLDPGIIANVVRPKRTYFTMLEETACIPLLGTFVRLLGAVPIPATPGALRILERAMSTKLSDLPFLHVFPEGECYLWNQEIMDFQLGAFYLACRLHLPVIPITTVLHPRQWLGRRSFHFAGRTFRVPPRVTVVVGEAVYPNQDEKGSVKREAREMSRRIHSVMQRTIDQRDGCKSLSKGRMPRLAVQQN